MVNLRELLGKCNLIQCQSADIEGGSAPPAALQKMAALVEAVNTVHSKVLRMEGNHASKFVSPSVERSASLMDDSVSQLDMIVVLECKVLLKGTMYHTLCVTVDVCCESGHSLCCEEKIMQGIIVRIF